MNSLTPTIENQIPEEVEKSLLEVMSNLTDTINLELQQLNKLDGEIVKRKHRLSVLRDALNSEISEFGDNESDEDILAAKHWIKIVDVLLNTPNDYMEQMTAEVLVELLENGNVINKQNT